MEKEQILSEVQTIFRDILDNKNIVLKPETIINEVEGWESLTYIQLVFSIEKHFKIKFISNEYYSWKKIGEIMDAIQQKLN